MKNNDKVLSLFLFSNAQCLIRTLSPIINRQRVITVKLAKFAKKINETKKPTISANFFVTSEKNSNGIRLQEWLEGIVL